MRIMRKTGSIILGEKGLEYIFRKSLSPSSVPAHLVHGETAALGSVYIMIGRNIAQTTGGVNELLVWRMRGQVGHGAPCPYVTGMMRVGAHPCVRPVLNRGRHMGLPLQSVCRHMKIGRTAVRPYNNPAIRPATGCTLWCSVLNSWPNDVHQSAYPSYRDLRHRNGRAGRDA